MRQNEGYILTPAHVYDRRDDSIPLYDHMALVNIDIHRLFLMTGSRGTRHSGRPYLGEKETTEECGAVFVEAFYRIIYDYHIALVHSF
jgi:hypothetical protein